MNRIIQAAQAVCQSRNGSNPAATKVVHEKAVDELAEALKSFFENKTIIIKQFTTQRRAQEHCQKIDRELKRKFGGRVNSCVNHLDSDVFQVELVGDFGDEIDLLGLV